MGQNVSDEQAGGEPELPAKKPICLALNPGLRVNVRALIVANVVIPDAFKFCIIIVLGTSPRT